MKKILVLLLSSVLLVSVFTACSVPTTSVDSTGNYDTTQQVAIDMSDLVLAKPESYSMLRRDYLTDKGKEIYDGLYDAALNFEEYVYVDKNNDFDFDTIFDKFNQIFSYYVLLDHPEIFWTEGGFEHAASYVNERNETVYTFPIVYGCQQSEIENLKSELDTQVNQMFSEIPDGSDYEKALWVYEWIMEKTVYIDRPFLSLGQNLDYSIYNLFINGKSNCNGYSKALSYILNKLSIPCTIAVGECDDGQLHAWNIIQLDDGCYHLDSTWDDRYNQYSLSDTIESYGHAYFCVNDNDIYKSRKLVDYFYAPKCKSDKYNYFIYNNLYFDSVNDETFDKAISFCVENSKNSVELKFADQTLLSEAKNYMNNENSNLFDLLQARGYDFGLNVSYGAIDEMNVLYICS